MDRVRRLEPWLTYLISGLARDLHARGGGGGDAATDLALPLPLAVLSELVGFAPATTQVFRDMTVAL